MKNQLSKLTNPLSHTSTHRGRLRIAVLGALSLHLLFLILLPSIPEFRMPIATNEPGLNVFLRVLEEPEEFEQLLNQEDALDELNDDLSEPSLGAASPESGSDPIVSEESPQVESTNSNTIENEISGDDTSVRTPTRVITSWTAIRRFTDLEVANYADTHPAELTRFKRSFQSQRSVRRRSNIESYKNQYGDYYVRDRSSQGDICFKQERETIPNELSTNTVYFFRCDDGPMKLQINQDG